MFSPIIDKRPLGKKEIVYYAVIDFNLGQQILPAVMMTTHGRGEDATPDLPQQLLALEFIDQQTHVEVSDKLVQQLQLNKNNIKPLTDKQKKYWQATLQHWQTNQAAMNLRLVGTDFQQRVWRAILSIASGKTISYSDLAKKINSHHRAVAKNGVGRNHICYFVPCHRVISKNGGIGGYGGGLGIKRKLLLAENISL